MFFVPKQLMAHLPFINSTGGALALPEISTQLLWGAICDVTKIRDNLTFTFVC